MKKTWIYLACGLVLSLAMSSCKDKEKENEEEGVEAEVVLKAAMTPYVNNTVIPTYKGMADYAIEIAADVEKILAESNANEKSENTALIETAMDHWKQSREYWERSEAFLYGPADKMGIDPHIDSWPFSETEFIALIGNESAMKEYRQKLIDNVELDEEEYGMFGFHALEYMLFEDGKAHKVGDFNNNQWVLMNIVANDLRNQTVLLEACWAGFDNISAAKQQILTAAGLKERCTSNYPNGFGDYMINPAEGRIFVSYTDAAIELVEGCLDIANEVGNIKIGTAAVVGGEDYDADYIESPYSLNSLKDFEDNIVSIRNAYFGSKSGDASVHDFIAAKDATVDGNLKTAIENAIASIQAIPAPFRDHADSEEARNAVKVCGTDLVKALQAVHTVLAGNEYVFEEED